LTISRAVALDTSRGWRIAKEKLSRKIDVVVALAMAALGAVRQGQARQEYEYRMAPHPVSGMGYGHSRRAAPGNPALRCTCMARNAAIGQPLLRMRRSSVAWPDV
jgi:hypothetical protein